MIQTAPQYLDWLYAIDPGVASSVVASFHHGVLYAIWHGVAWSGRVLSPGNLVLEIPRADQRDPRKTNDLIDLNGAGHWLAASINAATGWRCTFVPRYARSTAGEVGWKGSVEKPIHHSWALKALRPKELAIVQGEWDKARLKKDPLLIVDYVDHACDRLARTGKVSGYKNQIHNTLDAVALGLTQLGRL